MKNFVSICDAPSRCLCVRPACVEVVLHAPARAYEPFEFFLYSAASRRDPRIDMPVLAISWPKLNCLRFQSLN